MIKSIYQSNNFIIFSCYSIGIFNNTFINSIFILGKVSIIKTFDSQLEAARAFGLSRATICRVCRGYRQSAAGYGWVYHDVNFDKPVKQPPVPKPVLQYDLDGTLLAEYKSINAASKITGVDRHNIARCCDGYYRQLNGYVWKWGGDGAWIPIFRLALNRLSISEMLIPDGI